MKSVALATLRGIVYNGARKTGGNTYDHSGLPAEEAVDHLFKLF